MAVSLNSSSFIVLAPESKIGLDMAVAEPHSEGDQALQGGDVPTISVSPQTNPTAKFGLADMQFAYHAQTPLAQTDAPAVTTGQPPTATVADYEAQAQRDPTQAGALLTPARLALHELQATANAATRLVLAAGPNSPDYPTLHQNMTAANDAVNAASGLVDNIEALSKTTASTAVQGSNTTVHDALAAADAVKWQLQNLQDHPDWYAASANQGVSATGGVNYNIDPQGSAAAAKRATDAAKAAKDLFDQADPNSPDRPTLERNWQAAQSTADQAKQDCTDMLTLYNASGPNSPHAQELAVPIATEEANIQFAGAQYIGGLGLVLGSGPITVEESAYSFITADSFVSPTTGQSSAPTAAAAVDEALGSSNGPASPSTDETSSSTPAAADTSASGVGTSVDSGGSGFDGATPAADSADPQSSQTAFEVIDEQFGSEPSDTASLLNPTATGADASNASGKPEITGADLYGPSGDLSTRDIAPGSRGESLLGANVARALRDDNPGDLIILDGTENGGEISYDAKTKSFRVPLDIDLTVTVTQDEVQAYIAQHGIDVPANGGKLGPAWTAVVGAAVQKASADPSTVEVDGESPSTTTGPVTISAGVVGALPAAIEPGSYNDKTLYGPTRLPQASDIRQGSIGDCWLLGTAGAIVGDGNGHGNPQVITDAIAFDPETNSFDVTLHDKQGNEHIVNVSQQEIEQIAVEHHGGAPLQGQPIWPIVIEAAAAQLGDAQVEFNLGDGSLDVAHIDNRASKYDSTHPSTFDAEAIGLFTGIDGTTHDAATLDGDEVLFNFVHDIPMTFASDDVSGPFVAGHVFSVTNVQPNATTGEVDVTFRNPWGFSADGTPGGYTTVPWSEVQALAAAHPGLYNLTTTHTEVVNAPSS